MPVSKTFFSSRKRVREPEAVCWTARHVKEGWMRRVLAVGLVLTLVLLFTASPVLAGGDKVRGENGQGDVNQVQVMDPPPFQP